MKNKKEMTKEFLDFYSKNIDQKSKPLRGTMEFLNWAKKKIYRWLFVQISKRD